MYLEQEGIATVVIGLVRLHLQKVQPPRALWVPFELGRPMGSPNDSAFQNQVLNTALQLLDIESGPVVLQDFPADEPHLLVDSAWALPSRAADAIPAEVERLQPLYQQLVTDSGRTTVGITGLSLQQLANYVQHFTGNGSIKNPHKVLSDLALMRFAIDDLKAFYLESALATKGRPTSQQLLRWFWQQTYVAEKIREFRQLCLASDERKYQKMANSLVPRAWL